MPREKKPPKEGVFKPEDDSRVEANIRKLFGRVLAYHCEPELTPNDVFDLFVPKHLQQLALDATRHLELTPSYRFEFEIDGLGSFNLRCPGLPFFYPGDRPPVEGTPAWRKLMAWADKRLALGKEWARVREVFFDLKTMCTRKDYVRYYWPPIVTLLGNSPTAEQLRVWKPCSNPTRLPNELRRACLETMQAVTLATLLPAEKPEPKSPVEINLVHMPDVELGWSRYGVKRVGSRM